jgi:hypothetical protein
MSAERSAATITQLRNRLLYADALQAETNTARSKSLQQVEGMLGKLQPPAPPASTGRVAGQLGLLDCNFKATTTTEVKTLSEPLFCNPAQVSVVNEEFTAPATTTNPPVATSNEEIVLNQGIKIWKKGTPTNGFTTIGYETLMRQRGFQNAANNIARGVLSRKGNAAIVSSIINSQRLNFDMNTQDERLDGIDVRYQIIYIKP